MYKKISLLCFVIFLTLSSNAFAEKIATINIKKIFNDSVAAQKYQGTLNKRKEKFEKKYSALEKEIAQKDKKLSEQRNLLSPEDLNKKTEELKKYVLDIQRSFQEETKQFDKDSKTLVQIIEKNVNSIIEDLAKENKYDIVIQKSFIIFANKSLDISDEIIKRLNKKLPVINDLK